MTLPSSDDILKKVEASEGFINKLVIAWQEKHWVRLLLFLGFVVLSFLNQVVISSLIQFVVGNPKSQLPYWYFYVWLAIVLALFVTAFLAALHTTKIKLPDAPSEKSIIKGLRAYTREDSELFAKLQRGRILQDCLAACIDKDFRFGIVNGESGTGKTSFLLAGLCPSLDKNEYRSVFVKLTNDEPLESIRQVLTSQKEIKPKEAENKNLLELLQQATKENIRPIVLILDQFEQFFVTYKSKDSRKPFIQEMTRWYKECDALPVKILISVRGDFLYRLDEFQKEMEYKLSPQDNFRLEKFEPSEAANVFRVIAAEEKIEYNENFLDEITTNELSDSEDGLVSPVNVQILSWMIAGQKTKEEKGFNRRSFQKLGGVEGLLEGFLKNVLDARGTDLRRQNAVKVLLALTDLDKNTRAGALSLDDLKVKLEGIISAQQIEENIVWLSSGGVRLVTPVYQQSNSTYELAHERLIPALRKLANKELLDTDRASQILDQRLNEWIGNSHTWRYLLTLKEWWLIKQNLTLISWEPKRLQKEQFYKKSKKWFIQFSMTVTIFLLLVFGTYQAYQIYDKRPERQISHVKERLYAQFQKGDFDSLQDAVLLSTVLDANGEDKLLNEKIWQLVDKLDGFDRSRIITPLAIKYHELGQKDKALELLAQVEADSVNHHESSARYSVPIDFAELCIKLGQNDKALKVLSRVENDVKGFYENDVKGIYEIDTEWDSTINQVYVDLADSYRKLGREDKSLELLGKVQQSWNHYPSELKILMNAMLLSNAYSELEPTDQVLSHLSQILIESKSTSTYGVVIEACLRACDKLEKSEQAIQLLSKVENETNQLFVYNTRYEALIHVANLYNKFEQKDKSLELISQVKAEIADEDPRSKSLMSILLADYFMKFGLRDEGLNLLSQIRTDANNLEPKAKFEILAKIIEIYIKHDQKNEALMLLEQINGDNENSSADLSVLEGLIDSFANLDQKHKELMFLAKVQDIAKLHVGRGSLFTEISARYAILGEWEKARETASNIGDENSEIKTLIRLMTIWKSPDKDILSVPK